MLPCSCLYPCDREGFVVGTDGSIETRVLFCLLPHACGMRISKDRKWMQLFEEAHGLCVLLDEAKQQLEGW